MPYASQFTRKNLIIKHFKKDRGYRLWDCGTLVDFKHGAITYDEILKIDPKTSLQLYHVPIWGLWKENEAQSKSLGHIMMERTLFEIMIDRNIDNVEDLFFGETKIILPSNLCSILNKFEDEFGYKYRNMVYTVYRSDGHNAWYDFFKERSPNVAKLFNKRIIYLDL